MVCLVIYVQYLALISNLLSLFEFHFAKTALVVLFFILCGWVGGRGEGGHCVCVCGWEGEGAQRIRSPLTEAWAPSMASISQSLQ